MAETVIGASLPLKGIMGITAATTETEFLLSGLIQQKDFIFLVLLMGGSIYSITKGSS